LVAFFDHNDLDSNISDWQDILQRLPGSHPARRQGHFLVGHAHLVRHESSGRNEDLNHSILNLTEAALLPFRPSGKFNVHIDKIFFCLAFALLRRAEVFKQLIDANSVIQYFHHLRDQPMGKSGDFLTFFIHAFAIRAELGSGNGIQDIDDMIGICHELFDLDSSEDFAIMTAVNLCKAIHICGNSNTPVLDRCIKLLRQASIRHPTSPALSLALAHSLALRFDETLRDDDFNEATTILNGIPGSLQLGYTPDMWQQLSSATLIMLVGFRSATHAKPEDAEDALYHVRFLLRSSIVPDNLRPIFIRLLQTVADLRFTPFGVEESSGLQEALSVNLKVVGPSAFLDVNKHRGDIGDSHPSKARLPKLEEVDNRIRDLQGRFPAMLPGTFYYRQCLEYIVDSFRTKISLTNDPMDIDEAIHYCRLLIDSTPPGGTASCQAAISLARLHLLAFEGTHKIEDLDESIGLLIGVLKVPAGQALCDLVVKILIPTLLRRMRSFLEKPGIHNLEATQAMDETMQTVNETLRLASDNKYLSVPTRLRHSCTWAQILRDFSRAGLKGSSMTGSISTAYEKAISLMQESVMFAPNLQLQHSHLVAMLQVTETMPLDYASHLVHMGELTQAIETLERGRALLWSELRGLRTSIDHIAGVDPVLAEKYTEINWDLERVATSVLQSRSDGTEDRKGADPFGRLLVEQRKLLEERNKVISQVRSLPGLHNFLMTHSFDTLRSATSHGPVIVINHNKWRSDILILYDSRPSPILIPTSENFYDEGNKLRDELVQARKKYGLDSTEYNRALASVLKNLYNLVGRPVIDRLQKLNIPEQSRIWWCPTSVFCSLPLHAMGPIPSNHGAERYFSDLYIPSYTPTLSALIDSRNPGPQSQSSRRPSLLLVAQPDRSLPGVKGEIRVIRDLDIDVESLVLKDATTAAVLEGLRRHELVHFACHGNLEIGKPFDASFTLYGDERLKLLDIVHSRLPTAEFAFLSACHTAELTEDSIADEGLHLTAALQYCGFRSVVGTMWAMADTDGRDLARRVYRSMLTGNEDEPCYLRSAEALRDAVRELRNMSGVGLERWVNFVHYGA
jgi:CHAT domain-containing protein